MRQKIRHLGLEEVEQRKNACSSSLVLPEELPSVEEQRKQLELEVVVRQIQQTTTSNELPSVEEEKQLREMVQEHKRLNEIAGFFGKSPASVKMKINRLKLVVVVRQIQHTTTNELPSVEEALKLLAAISGLSGTVLGIFVGQKTGPKVNHGTLMKCVNFGN